MTWILTIEMTADIVMKPLSPVFHVKHIPSLGLVRIP